MGNCLSLSPIRAAKFVPNDENGGFDEIVEIVRRNDEIHPIEIEMNRNIPAAAVIEIEDHFVEKPEEVIHRISQELADFREQLKKSQDVIQQMQSQASLAQVTQSCPVLVEEEVAKPKLLVTCSTQTEVATIPTICSTSTTNNTNNTASKSPPKTNGHSNGVKNTEDLEDFSDIDEEISGYMNKVCLIDDRFNLTTVLEEAEETETSPFKQRGVRGGRLSSSSSSSKNKLGRHGPTTLADDDLMRSDPDDCKSEQEYLSAMSSLAGSRSGSRSTSTYNSFERPLQISKGGNNDENGDDYFSESDTTNTFGSPISSPSSPTYMTPSQGSSSQGSQETLTNFDGDKTPLIEDIHESRDDVQSCPPGFREYEIKNSDLKKQRLSPQSTGGYARLISDVYGEFGLDDGFRPHILDTDDESEKYWATLNPNIENLYSFLSLFKEKREPSVDDWNSISKRFEQLVFVFKTNHISLPTRAEHGSKEFENAQASLKDISLLLKTSLSTLQNCLKKSFDPQRVPQNISDELMSIDHSFLELNRHVDTVSKTSRRAGMMEIEKRMYKMIEVMILYVHILQTRLHNMDRDLTIAKNLLQRNRLADDFSKERSFGKQLKFNNNTDDKILWNLCENHSNGNGRSLMRFERQPSVCLPSMKCPDFVHTDMRFSEIEKPSKGNIFIRFKSELYLLLLPLLTKLNFSWPWNWDQNGIMWWKEVKDGFSILLIIYGFFLIFNIIIYPCFISSTNLIIRTWKVDGDCSSVMIMIPRSKFIEIFCKIFQENANLEHYSPPEI